MKAKGQTMVEWVIYMLLVATVISCLGLVVDAANVSFPRLMNVVPEGRLVYSLESTSGWQKATYACWGSTWGKDADGREMCAIHEPVWLITPNGLLCLNPAAKDHPNVSCRVPEKTVANFYRLFDNIRGVGEREFSVPFGLSPGKYTVIYRSSSPGDLIYADWGVVYRERVRADVHIDYKVYYYPHQQ